MNGAAGTPTAIIHPQRGQSNRSVSVSGFSSVIRHHGKARVK